MERINMAVRSYKKPKSKNIFIQDSKPYRFDSESR